MDRDALIREAARVRPSAYAPYSRYLVGAALLGESGKVYTGVNVENASYGLTICAERNAVFHAVAEGETRFTAIAVVTENGGSPCGACRQVLAEFSRGMAVHIGAAQGPVSSTTIDALLPFGFSGDQLPFMKNSG